MRKAIYTLVMVAALLLNSAAPCTAPNPARSACPMTHCDRPEADALAAPSCCCPPASAPASPSKATAVVELLAVVLQVAPQGAEQAVATAALHATLLSAPAEPVPLYLLHTSLLI